MNNNDNYKVEAIFRKRRVAVRDILTLDEYGIVYKGIGGEYLIVYYNGEEIWMSF